MKFYKKWPRWIRWGIVFSLLSTILSLVFFYGAELFYYSSSTHDRYGFDSIAYLVPFLIINLPGIFILENFNPGSLLEAIPATVTLSSVFYFFIGSIVSYFKK